MKNCPVCQSEISEETKFCPECGASITDSEDKSLDKFEPKEETKKDESSEDTTENNDNSSSLNSDQERWYYVEDGKSIGPFERADFINLFIEETIAPETYVWSKGMKEWTKLKNTELYHNEDDSSSDVSENTAIAEVVENGVAHPIETFEDKKNSIDLDLNKSPKPNLENTKVSSPSDTSNAPKEITPPPHQETFEEIDESQEWYYVVNGRTVGPFSEGVMARNIQQGNIDGLTYVWKEGFLDWEHLKDTSLANYLNETIPSNATIPPRGTTPYVSYPMVVPTRNIILYILLTLVTCGIFEFVWLYMIASDLNKLNAQKGKAPLAEPILVVILSIFTCGIYTVYYLWKAGNAVYDLSDHRLSDNSMLLALLGLFLTPASLAILQDQINALVESGEFR